MKILITGAAGFIGFHLSKKLLLNGHNVIGIDNINDYYDPNLKLARLNNIEEISVTLSNKYFFEKIDIVNKKLLEKIFEKYNPEIVVNLAAQAGVRYSIQNPNAYIQSNLLGFANLIELSKTYKVQHFVYASSSSVYGGNTKQPFSESDNVDHPLSLYAATKRSNELIAHSYSNIYDLPTTGLRFFTVYGPWGRPDMALFLFADAIIKNQEIKVFNNGKMIRDFTFIDDVVESLSRLIFKFPLKNLNSNNIQFGAYESWAPFKIFNIGNSKPTDLMKYISHLEEALGKKALIKFMPIQPGDVAETSSTNEKLQNWISYKPNTDIQKGVTDFVNWYKAFYGYN